ncbi:MAG: putative glycoside hydrolase [Spirochaetota bacterium]|nr:putative glycoside hydrolase [Spirochaetota bacterium]
MRSEDSGNSWKDFNMGLPKDCVPITIKSDSSGNLYLTTKENGIYKLPNGNALWESINSKDFLARSLLNSEKRYRKISALSIDYQNTQKVLIATKHSIFSSKDGGKSWKRISMRGLKKRNYITALAIGRKGDVFAGTSFNGMFRKNSSKFVKKTSGLPREPYAGRLSFYDEIAAIAIDTNNKNKIYTAINFHGGVFVSSNRGKSWQDLKIPIKNNAFVKIFDLNHYDNSLFVSTSAGIFRMCTKNMEWSLLELDDLFKKIPDNPSLLSLLFIDKSKKYPPLFYSIKEPVLQKSKNLLNNASDKRAIYTSIPSIRRNFKGLVETILKCNLNAIVIDMKDDLGDIYFPSKNVYANEIGAIKRYRQIKEVLKTLKDNNIYTIARIVVFKDKNLYKAYKNKYAVWDKKLNKPWKGNPREFWVDPHSEFVRRYNVDIAKEAQDIGFDEIQFDYIRFPSDGPLTRCLYRHNGRKYIYKSEVMSDFLIQAKRNIDAPISVDIYGYNAWYHFGNWIGQDLEAFSEIVDVICPMVYPSHFGKSFYMKGPREKRPYRIVYNSGKRALMLMTGKAALRPYLQAFKMYSPTWGKGYIKNQVQGASESGCSGYTFWNARGDYKILRKALQ